MGEGEHKLNAVYIRVISYFPNTQGEHVCGHVFLFLNKKIIMIFTSLTLFLFKKIRYFYNWQLGFFFFISNFWI